MLLAPCITYSDTFPKVDLDQMNNCSGFSSTGSKSGTQSLLLSRALVDCVSNRATGLIPIDTMGTTRDMPHCRAISNEGIQGVRRHVVRCDSLAKERTFRGPLMG